MKLTKFYDGAAHRSCMATFAVLCTLAIAQSPDFASELEAKATVATLAAPQDGDEVSVQSGYACLNEMQPDKAIYKLTPAFINALRAKDFAKASRILRLIAFAFRLDENDFCAAQTALNAIQLDPSSDEAKLEAAEYLFRCGQWKKAQEMANELTKSHSPSVALIAFAHQCLRKSEFNKAIDAINAAPDNVQNKLRVQRTLVMLYLMNEDYKSASGVLRRLAGSCGNSYMEEIYLGRASAVTMSFAEALKHFKKAGSIRPQDPLWQGEIGVIEMKQNRIKEAREYLRSAVSQKRLSSHAFVNFAILEAYFGSTQEAKAALDHIIAFRPAAADTAFANGLVCERLEDWNGARSAFDRALQLNPYNGSAYLHLLNIERQLKLHSDEMATAHRWLEMNPASFLAQVECGRTYFANGQKEKGLQCFDRAMKLAEQRNLQQRPNAKSSYLTLLAYRSASYFELGKKEESFKDALAFNQRKPEPKKAGGLFLRPIKFDTNKIEAKGKQLEALKHALTADVLYEVQNLGAAEGEYKLAIAEEPENILWHSCRLKVLLDQKNFVEAAKEDLYVSQHMVTHIKDVFK